MNNIIKYIEFLLFLSVFIGFMNSCSEDTDLKSFVPEIPGYSLDKGEIPVPKDGGDFTVNVKSNLPWRARTNSGWITLKSESGMKDGSFSFTAERNRTVEERTGEIIVWVTSDTQKTVKIIQAPSEAGDLVNHYYVKTTGTNTNDGLSWATATTLSNALDIMAPGDYIHIAAGTYIPTNMISGGNQDGDITFEIHSNVTLIGGYPADATDGAVSNPESNETILNGNNQYYHVVAVTAPVETGKKVSIQNLSIKNGKAGAATAGQLNINGGVYYRARGAGLIIVKSAVEVTNCKISDNEAGNMAGGVYIFSGANAIFNDTDITGNKNTGNCGGIMIESATTRMTNCNITGNTATGVAGGIYTYSADTPTFLYLYNCTVANNSATLAAGRGGGFYVREFSRVQIVNSTFYGNQCGSVGGGGILIYGAAGKESSVDMINSTVSGNKSTGGAAGVGVLVNTTFKAYNSIISGNDATDFTSAANTATLSYMAVNNQLLDASGTVVNGQVFDPVTMLGGFENNGGRTKTIMLSASSPAATSGMTPALLETLASQYSPTIDLNIINKDQIGNSRSGQSAMGAVIPN